MKQELSKYAVRHLLQSVPGIGMLNSAILISQVGSPRRFPNKRAFWGYCGLAVRSRSSGNFKVVDGALVRNHKSMQTRGLNRNRNAALKEVFKTAAIAACRQPEFQRMREGLVDRGISQPVAMVNVARKLATIVLTVWKKGEKYNAAKMTESEAVQSPSMAEPG